MAHFLILIVATLFLIPGIIMAATPFPGLFYMFLVALVAAMLEGFRYLSGFDIGILAALTVVALSVDFVAGMIGTKASGGHWSSVFWGFLGFLLGAFIIPVPVFGNVAGMFLGVLGAELYRTRDVRHARKAAVGSVSGWAVGTAFKLIASVVFIVLFVIFGIR